MCRWMIAWVFGVWLLGCAPPSDALDAATDGGPIVLQLGTGQSAFTPIDVGETLLLARGCQGLQHVWIALRAEGLDPRGMRVDLSLTSAGEPVSEPFVVRLSFSVVDGASELYGLTLVVPEPDLVLERELVLSVSLMDRDGRSASESLPVRVAWGDEVCR